MKLKELLNVMKNDQHMIQLLNAKDHGFLECVEVKELLNPQNKELTKYLECEMFDMYSEEIDGDTQLTVELVFVTYPEFMHNGQLYCIVELKPHKANYSLDLYGIVRIVEENEPGIFVSYMFGNCGPEEMIRQAKDFIDLKRKKAYFLREEILKLIKDDYNPSAYGLEEDKEQARKKQNLCKHILLELQGLL